VATRETRQPAPSRFIVLYLLIVGLVLVGFGLYTIITGALFDALLALGSGLVMLATVAVLRLVTSGSGAVPLIPRLRRGRAGGGR
jgi:hypothetical protein